MQVEISKSELFSFGTDIDVDDMDNLTLKTTNQNEDLKIEETDRGSTKLPNILNFEDDEEISMFQIYCINLRARKVGDRYQMNYVKIDPS